MKKSLLMFFVLLFSLFFIVGYSDIALADSDDDDDDSDGSSSGGPGSSSGGSSSSGGGSDDDDGFDDDDDDDDDDSGSDDDDSGSDDDDDDNGFDDDDDDDNGFDDDDDDKIKGKFRNAEGKSKLEIKSKEILFDEFGNKITLLTETKTRNGKVETITKRKIQSPDGTEITFKTKTKIEDGRERITNTIEVHGVGVSTKLSVREEIRDDRTILKAELSTGIEQNILILPDVAAQIAIDNIQSTNNFRLELNEFLDGDTRKAVFSAKATRPGKLLGIFNTNVNLETLIDTKTGEIIETNRPWWAFLVVGSDDATVCHLEDETSSITMNVLISAVQDHLIHGDSVGECVAVCGDGVIQRDSEQCDDGNILDGDGCNSLCQVVEIPVTEPVVDDGEQLLDAP